MSELSNYLMEEYFSHYMGDRNDVIPSPEVLERGLANHPDKIVIVRDDKIRGAAIFVTISDETYDQLKDMDVTRLDVLVKLLEQNGPHVHFILLCADGMRTILSGIQEVKRRTNPKSISWWNPDLTKLHKYKIRS